MSVGYSGIQWSRHKRTYDALVAAAVVGYLGLFFAVSRVLWAGAEAISDEIVLMRSLGSCAIVLLHIILCIGPLARLNRRFLPLLYNRRHLGVTTFLVALAHGMVAIGYYHGFGVRNPLVSLLVTNTNYLSLRAFPFQILGLLALVILFLMAATSHDFWLKNLTAVWWKRLHMMVYVAYALLVAHVGLGALQGDRGVLGPALMLTGVLMVAGLHVATGIRERERDKESSGEWVDAGPAAEIPQDRARTLCARGERIAVFRYQGRISAVTNVCAHQGGPLGEGKIIDGCITCPWHGWQYRPQDGCSPPPFTEKITTYQVRIVKGRVEVNPRPLAPGTPVEPAVLSEGTNV